MPVRSWNIDHSCFSISVLSSSVWPVRNTQFSAPVGAALPAVNPEPLGYERKTTRTKLSGTFIIAVWIRVISFAIFAFVCSGTNPSSVIAVYNGIRIISKQAGTDIAELPATTDMQASCQVSDLPHELLND